MQHGTKAVLRTLLLTLLVAAGASQVPAEEPLPATGEVLIEEWIADIPWHQKLSTTDSNLIDVPFMLPYEAIPSGLEGCKDVTTKTGEARCMLQHGIVNAMGIKRTDTLYESEKAPDDQSSRCDDGKCVQVKLEIQRLHTQTNESCQGWTDGTASTTTTCAPEIVTNDRTYIGQNPQNDPIYAASFGFAINEATVFAPWRPWYMGHYCGWDVISVIDSVCYDAYFTTQLQAYAPAKEDWPHNRPAYFFPTDSGQDGPNGLYCKKGETQCNLYLAQVTWSPKSQTPPENEEFPVNDCDITKRPCEKSEEQLKQLQAEVKTATERLDGNFNEALEQFQDIGRFPWTMGEKYIPAKGATFQNMPGSPYIGYYDLVWSQPPSNRERKVVDNGPMQFGNQFQAASYSLPKACTKKDFAGARLGYGDSVAKLRECGLTLEIHTTGYFEQWRHFFADKTPDDIMVGNDMVGSLVNTALTGALTANQYGRTMFFMAGLPEQKIAASFYPFDMDELDYVSGLSIYDQVYGAGPYTQYLPMVNPDGDVPGMVQPYNDNMWHSFFMSNHMNQSPEHFIRGIRGRTLWHNEWRSNLMFLGYYNKVAGQEGKTFTQNADDAAKNAEPAVLRDGVTLDEQLAHRDFPAGFQPGDHKVPYHGNTCDSCHIRNGSGIPVAPNGQLSNIHTERGLKPRFILRGDYTYSNGYNPRLNDPTGKGNDPIFPSMKMVLFDLKERPRPQEVDANDHTTPASDAFAASGYYSHKIMNFYGNSFHVNLKDKLPTYDLKYVDIGSDEDMGTGGPFEIVDKTPRERCMPDKTSHERCMPESRLKTYIPKRVVVKHFDTGDRCKDRDINPFAPLNKGWPTNCDQVSGPAVDEAIGKGEVGFMHLLGKRLGNTPLIEMIPDQAIKDASEAQKTAFGRGLEGQYPLAAGTRSGLSLSDMNYRSCRSGKLGTSSMDCYIGRWGWIGDRASLEDQVANAAHVEQNITTKKSFALLEKSNQPRSRSELVRYMSPLCGPADLGCQTGTNSDITEQEVRDMATYQRWIGIPQRSEFQVETKAVQDGERLFRSDELGCNKCHIIDKIPFVENDNMLPDEEREKLKKLLIQEDGKTDYPFVSYLGTDLLLHDMGYLSQVAAGPLKKGTLKKGTLRTDSNARRRGNNNDDNGLSVKMRDQNGKIRPGFDAYFQLIRTPPLKGMRFNRFVTDSHHNKTTSTGLNGYEARAGCDFLLHDGRACDAIEAAYLHDGPAVKKIGMIKGLNGLSAEQMASLRAFLYSL